MREQLITLDAAKTLKEKGFTLLCEYAYFPKGGKHELAQIPNRNGDTHQIRRSWYSAPRKYDLQRWLRKNYQLHIDVQPNVNTYWQVRVINLGNESIKYESKWLKYDYTTYELALEGGIEETLKLIEV